MITELGDTTYIYKNLYLLNYFIRNDVLPTSSGFSSNWTCLFILAYFTGGSNSKWLFSIQILQFGWFWPHIVFLWLCISNWFFCRIWIIINTTWRNGSVCIVVCQPLLNRVTDRVGNMLYSHDCVTDVNMQHILTRPVGICKSSVKELVFDQIRIQGVVPRAKGALKKTIEQIF